MPSDPFLHTTASEIDGRRPPRRSPRPKAMHVVRARCIQCSRCEELVPEILLAQRAIAVTPASLDAMAACPTGAIQWLEEDVGPDVAEAPEAREAPAFGEALDSGKDEPGK